MIRRRKFLRTMLGTVSLAVGSQFTKSATAAPVATGVAVKSVGSDEDILGYVQRLSGSFDERLYKQVLGAANEFKEGDAIVGVAAADELSRKNARSLLANTRIGSIDGHPILRDQLFAFNEQCRDVRVLGQWSTQTFSQLKEFLLAASEPEIHAMEGGLSSEVIGCLVKLMSNNELIALGAKIFNPLPGSQIGSKGYLGARVQPNSPTDNLDDIRWQVLDAFSYAVGDVLLGTNPVSSDPDSVAAVEQTLKDLLVTFGIDAVMPHCVLSHIDVQAQVERRQPGSTELWFQSIAGSDSANATFDLSVDKMVGYAKLRTGRFGLYFETGQGADFTNGHGHGFDMVLHESRKYGFARGLSRIVASTRSADEPTQSAWVHLNDVAGFIGPEVFRSREQLVRCCLEDIVMGKLHGLTIGLDVCSTLHMDVTLDDLDWCLEQIAPANPAYLMALPTKIDPMLGYLTTGYQDHVRLREKHGYRVNDRMWSFFKELQVIDSDGRPTRHFGDPLWVYLQYRRHKQDGRADEEILAEGRRQLAEVRGRGIFIAEGYGDQPSSLNPKLHAEIEHIYEDAKKCIWREWQDSFIATIPAAKTIATQSANRSDYILHPASGEVLSQSSRDEVLSLRRLHPAKFNTQLVISEGLNALAVMDDGNLLPLITGLKRKLAEIGYAIAPDTIVVRAGRVRAGYRIGELLFGGLEHDRTILHVIGERPGSGHHTMSVYITKADGAIWGVPDRVDHNITKVVSGIATTALVPHKAIDEIARILV